MNKTEFIERGALDAARDYGYEIKCRDCIWRSYDMDGNYCAHPESLDVSGGFGQSLELARSPGPPLDISREIAGSCGPSAANFQHR